MEVSVGIKVAARGLEWPSLAMSSLVVAPSIAASVPPVWRRSWK